MIFLVTIKHSLIILFITSHRFSLPITLQFLDKTLKNTTSNLSSAVHANKVASHPSNTDAYSHIDTQKSLMRLNHCKDGGGIRGGGEEGGGGGQEEREEVRRSRGSHISSSAKT